MVMTCVCLLWTSDSTKKWEGFKRVTNLERTWFSSILVISELFLGYFIGFRIVMKDLGFFCGASSVFLFIFMKRLFLQRGMNNNKLIIKEHQHQHMADWEIENVTNKEIERTRLCLLVQIPTYHWGFCRDIWFFTY